MMLVTYLAEVFREITLIAILGQVWALPFLIYFNTVDTSQTNKWVIWAVTTVLLSYPSGE